MYIYIYLLTLSVSYGLQSSYLGTISLPPPPSFFHHSFSGVIEQSECRVELSEGMKALPMYVNLLAWLLLLRVRRISSWHRYLSKMALRLLFHLAPVKPRNK